jgi:hypothetical protein
MDRLHRVADEVRSWPPYLRVESSASKKRRSDAGKPRGPFKGSAWALWEPKPRPVLTTDHGWLAGIIDGEGCLTIERDGRSPSIRVGMTDKEAIERCQRIAGVGSMRLRELANRDKPVWLWCVYSANARDIAWLLLPLLTTKRHLADAIVKGVMPA